MEEQIFHFNDRPALRLQDDSACARLFEDFWRSMLDGDDDDSRNLLPVAKLQSIRDGFDRGPYWFAKYASVVLFQQLDSFHHTAVLIGLDGWKSMIHASTTGRENTATCDVFKPAIFELGLVETSQIDNIITQFRNALATSEANNRGDNRRSVNGHGGNQKTPSFASSKLLQVIWGANPPPVEGGTTDVGLHTGCIPRNTSFPLVLVAVLSMLRRRGEQDGDEVFRKCVSVYFHGFLRSLTSRLSEYDARGIDRAVAAIRELEPYLLGVQDSEFVNLLLFKIKLCKNRLEALKPRHDLARFTLNLEPVENLIAQLRPPSFPSIPPVRVVEDAASRLKQARADAEANLHWSNLDCTKFYGSSTEQDAWVKLSLLNDFFWRAAAVLDSPGASGSHSTKDLRDKLQHFMLAIKKAKEATDRNTHVMSVVLSSYKLLAVWICYCWAFRVAEEKHSFFKAKCSPALMHSDLIHLVLDSSRARTALEHVRSFLRNREERSLRPLAGATSDSLSLALDFGLESACFQRFHTSEAREADLMIEARWKKVQEIQRQLARLDADLRHAQVQVQVERQRRQRAQRDSHKAGIYGSGYRSAYLRHLEAENRAQDLVRSLQSQIWSLEAQPPDVLFRLPRDKQMALKWLFFLFMPAEFRDLAVLASLGQTLLWANTPMSSSYQQDLLQWFVSRTQACNDSWGVPTVEALELKSLSPPPRLSTPNIRQYSRETGVFFPDSFSVDPSWKDGNHFLPRDHAATVRLYTEGLPSGVDGNLFLQQFVPMLPTNTRENLAIASRYSRPSWMNQEEYLAFCVLRESPRTQIRNLAEALAEGLLNFEHSCVHVVVKQLMFHVGESEWWLDLSEGGKGYTVMEHELVSQLTVLKDSPKDKEKLLLFGIISSFFGQYDLRHAHLVREFAKTLRGWADNMRRADAESDQISTSQYWKQAQMYGYALLCYSMSGGGNDSDNWEMVELVILFRNNCLFASDVKDRKSLDQPVIKAMSWQIGRILDSVRRELRRLTGCLALILDDVPSALPWKAVSHGTTHFTGCFEASTSSGHLFSVNILNGTVLVDGVPPGLLPKLVLEKPLYSRTFGKRNFETVVLGFRHYRTARRVDGRYLYEFLVEADGLLRIFEFDTSLGRFSVGPAHKLQLVGRRRVDLPEILREKHSHWYSQDHNAILVRQPAYDGREVEIVITEAATYCLPIGLRRKSLHSLRDVMVHLRECCVLMLGKTCATKVLSRFEDHRYIHITLNAQKSILRYSLPRCKLAFEERKQKVWSVEFKGFFLNRVQLLEDTMYGLECNLRLSNLAGQEKVVIPSGKVLQGGKIDIANEWNDEFFYHIYNVHCRFRNLVAVESVGRLHLAALYASTSCHLTDKRLAKPGADVAVELVRQCWTNEPLSLAESAKLLEVSALSNLSSTLRLACTWIWRSSMNVEFLYFKNQARLPALEYDIMAINEYRRNMYATRLPPSEEFLLLGTRQPSYGITISSHQDSETALYVREAESALNVKYKNTTPGLDIDRGFPLDRPVNCLGLETTVYDDIEESYKTFCRLPFKHANKPPDNDLASLTREASELRRRLEEWSIYELSSGNGSIEHRLFQLSGRRQLASPVDLLAMLSEPETTVRYCPGIGSARIQVILRAILDWAVLCVWEDKLRRIAAANDDLGLLTELECVREWQPSEHPRWLAFEVEQQLQIRPNQFAIVDQLRQRPGSVVQLNMGLGKTRVIVPMLILDLVSKQRIGRINVLASILAEAMNYYRNVLVASIQNVRLYSLPFHRDMPLEGRHAQLLSDEIARCQEGRGCFVVTPQHRNSLLLKQYNQGVAVEGLTRPFIDIIDESDAILDHSFQLVYAIGTQRPLPDGRSRWIVIETFLQMLAFGGPTDVAHLLSDPDLVHSEHCNAGEFPKLRLLEQCKGHFYEVGVALCRHLVDLAPHEFRWMKRVAREDVEQLVQILSDPKLKGVAAMIDDCELFKEYESAILATRGFIAFGLLFHGLMMRHRVNYGLNKSSARRMAVPFHASDTPKMRAQFSHPDMEILYTALSYLHEGLTKDQLRSTLLSLQTLGPSAQKIIYEEWIESIYSEELADVISRFSSILMVDVDNAPQFELMYNCLRGCVGVVFFWLNRFVFPVETHQFPQKRATSAWNLSESGVAVGFSGTDDNRFLLRRSIWQISPRDEYLRATNGEMIQRILDCTAKVVVFDEKTLGMEKLWQVVVRECVSQGCQALIDVGGLMAGSNNKEVAKLLSEVHAGTEFRGAVYYDTDSREWRVLERESGVYQSLQSSFLTEGECLVYFDESRCRGSDMKLPTDASALVTIEAKTRKDQFLQGCARMRKLRRSGQSLIIAGTSEALSEESTAKSILERILRNTVVSSKKGLMTFYERGLEYDSFPDPIPEDCTLQHMYSGSLVQYEDVSRFLDATHDTETSSETVTDLVSYCKSLGRGTSCETAQLSQECERELEQEAEHEEEAEPQFSNQQPSAQQDWDFEAAFTDPEPLFGTLFVRLSEFIGRRLGKVSSIDWGDRVYCTPNFWKTIRACETHDLSLFLRLVKSMLVLPDGRVVLLSNYELEKLLPHWWSHRDTLTPIGNDMARLVKYAWTNYVQTPRPAPKAFLYHLISASTQHRCFGGDEGIVIPEDVLATIKLFRGYVSYSARERVALADMFSGVTNVRSKIHELLAMRSRQHYFDRSDLDNFSFDME